jgi:ferrous iron transport protein B
MRKVGRVILGTTAVLWVLLNVPIQSDADLAAAGVNPQDHAAVSAYVIDHSAAAKIGRAVEPVFQPLGFDWRVNVGILASLSAREVFVATLGQVASAENPDKPADALKQMTVQSGPRAGQQLFTAPVLAALLAFFLYALQCASTIGVLRRESGSWKWPAIAFGYLFVVAWTMAFLTRLVVGALA